jgi:Tol biopolymer transport system component
MRVSALIFCFGAIVMLSITVGGCGTTVNPGDGGNDNVGGTDDIGDTEDVGGETYDTLILAGSRTGHYVLVDPETGEDIVEVEPDTIGMNEPTLGYQGERVYFLSPPTTGTGRADIFGCDAMTGEQVVNLTADLEDFSASTPDGSASAARLVFTNTEDNHVYALNEDGSGLTQLTFDEEEHTLLNGTPVLSLGQYLPTWSPDGSRIAYQARVGEVGSIGTQYEVLIVMDADGASKEIIFDRQGTAHYREVSWSHDGAFIMVNDVSDEGVRELVAVSVASTTVSDLTDALLTGTSADFGNMWMSPTDFRIVYNYYVPGGGDLYMAELEATGDTVSMVGMPSQLTEDYSVTLHGYALPDWAPCCGTTVNPGDGGNDNVGGTEDIGDTEDVGGETYDTLILAGSRTGHYVLVDPETGEDIVEVEPDTIGMNAPTLGYQGERVYFLSPPTTGTGRADIFGCDAMTGEQVVNLTADLEDFSASTPDGSASAARLVFTNTEDNHVYALNEDGSGLTQLTFDEEEHTLLNGTPVLSLGQYLPTWSPDGSRIAYQARVGEVGSIGTQYEVLIVMDADGASKEIIFDRQGTAHYREVSWSHDGAFIMVNDVSDEGVRELVAVSVASTTVSDLTDALLTGTSADFGNMWMSPTDFRIVYNYYVPGGGDLYMAELEATGDTVSMVGMPSQLTEDYSVTLHGYALPDWAPYGESVGDPSR